MVQHPNDLRPPGAQTLVARSVAFTIIPLVVATILLIDLIWEVVRSNVSPTFRQEWPFRFTILDSEVAAVLLVAVGGLIFAREQFARSVRPLIGWSSDIAGNSTLMDQDPSWLIRIHNGSPGPCVVHECFYRVSIAQSNPSENPSSEVSAWGSYGDVVESLAAVGLKIGRDYGLDHSARGGVIRSLSAGEGRELAAFSASALHLIESLDIKFRVIDIAGNTHERVVYTLYSVPSRSGN